MEKTYSVLMSVYQKEKPEYLKISMESMFNQTVPTDDFVLMCDGPLNEALDLVIAEFQKKYHTVLHVIRLKENQGLGHALRVGVSSCKNNLIARMDSDDISRPDRCEKQLRIFHEHPEYSIVGGIIEEFSTSIDTIDATRVVPEKHDEIIEFARKRDPFNHPSVMYKKADVLKAGNYSDAMLYMEDYSLWVDMLIQGMKGYNIQEPLVWMRADSNLFKRRSGKMYIQVQLDLFKKMRDVGFISNTQYLKSVVVRGCSSVAPNWLRRFMYKRILRKH